MEDYAHVTQYDGESSTENDLDDVEDLDKIPVASKRSVTDDSNNYNLSSGK